jgi:hypothetical protein
MLERHDCPAPCGSARRCEADIRQLSGLAPPTVISDLPNAFSKGVWLKWRINHPKRSDSLLTNRTLHEQQRTEAGIDGLARANLRFSEQGGP